MVNKKDGMTVQELENFGKKYKFELAFVIYFVLATVCSFLVWGPALSLYLAGLGGAVGIWLPEKIAHMSKAVFALIFKQDRMIQLIFAGVGVIVAIFLAPVIFLALGLMGGMAIYGQNDKQLR